MIDESGMSGFDFGEVGATGARNPHRSPVRQKHCGILQDARTDTCRRHAQGSADKIFHCGGLARTSVVGNRDLVASMKSKLVVRVL